ncbi:Chromate transport protein-like protein [Emericellopsis cladophorae]|uniref:Chromate transport protein-like protein n=1 Tax=Emericellopsis cladophorae TaxID=2686198 RepID=A0A9Q0BEV5_9HYPO|nr:Chromate transport protein-like protein [Emericellopsis cladophorae]KAI6782271.1 Chromate transport protein-like protein [Emericellopsis cladophorae]
MASTEKDLTFKARLWETVKVNWHLGFTSFGGPPVHFKIFRDKYVVKLRWLDEQLYQELFSICQALSGPGSTKMHYCINLLHAGFPFAVLGFLIWSLPGAIGMYALSIGVSNISEQLPRAVYALLSGLNAATVGIIVLAAVELSQKAITDKVTRILVFLAGAAGLLYNALWYFPVLMVASGIVTIIHDFRWLHPVVHKVTRMFEKKKDEEIEMERNAPQSTRRPSCEGEEERPSGDTRNGPLTPPPEQQDNQGILPSTETDDEPRVIPESHRVEVGMSWKVGLGVISLFLLSFTVIMVLRGVLPGQPLLYRLFANMYLAGTIIFGGGPVVIPLLREYVVSEGWVSPRDFLIGLAIIQAFPGPNFNFSVYLGGLTAINGGQNAALGALVAYLGIFLPGMWLVHGTVGIWSAIRGWRWVKSAVRGLNAGAVGLIYTAVYRLWQIGYIDEGYRDGTSLAVEPWWVVVTATSFVGGMWFGLKPWVAIVLGGVMGMIWYGVVTT